MKKRVVAVVAVIVLLVGASVASIIYMKSGRGLKQLVKALRARQEAGEMYGINAVSNCGMDSEKIYHSLEELENADVYLTTVIVKRKKKNN